MLARHGHRMRGLFSLWIGLTALNSTVQAADTFKPYQAGEVPQSVTDLWKDYDARQEPLEIRVVKQWKSDGVITRYVTFKVGTFKGADARIAAYYSFPDNGQKNAAFVWSHGGGQRAERVAGSILRSGDLRRSTSTGWVARWRTGSR